MKSRAEIMTQVDYLREQAQRCRAAAAIAATRRDASSYSGLAGHYESQMARLLAAVSERGGASCHGGANLVLGAGLGAVSAPARARKRIRM
jgi:hypothetical protein